MILTKKLDFFSPSFGKIDSRRMVEKISDFVKEDPLAFYRLVIGTDSQVHRIDGKSEIDFVTAVVVHRQGRGARYFWRKEKTLVKQPVLRDRIYTETLISLSVAQEIVPLLRKAVSAAKYDLKFILMLELWGQQEK